MKYITFERKKFKPLGPRKEGNRLVYTAEYVLAVEVFSLSTGKKRRKIIGKGTVVCEGKWGRGRGRNSTDGPRVYLGGVVKSINGFDELPNDILEIIMSEAVKQDFSMVDAYLVPLQ